jgi:putative addiction module killer protein
MLLPQENVALPNATPRRVIVYTEPDEHESFTDWLDGLRDSLTQKRILTRLEQGNFGDCKPVGDGVSELRMFFGAGYRVYLGESGCDLVVLLCGGDKSSQDEDIAQAKLYWRRYLMQ